MYLYILPVPPFPPKECGSPFNGSSEKPGSTLNTTHSTLPMLTVWANNAIQGFFHTCMLTRATP